jgi:hypothetical protein
MGCVVDQFKDDVKLYQQVLDVFRLFPGTRASRGMVFYSNTIPLSLGIHDPSAHRFMSDLASSMQGSLR